MKKIGIFSGTFDPIHNGHLELAHQAINQCGIDKVFFMVEPRPRRKQGVKAFVHRLEMARLAIEDNPKFGVITLGQNRFTVENTLPKLKARFDGADIYMLMGDDMLPSFTAWPKLDKLLQDIRFVIASRRYSASEIRHKIQSIEQIRSLEVNYELIEVNSDVSSSKIKAAVKAGELPVGLSDRVGEYIKNNNLYADSSL